MSPGDELLNETPEELYEDAPCGLLSCRLDGTIVGANRTFEAWTGHDRRGLVGRRFVDLLTAGGRIYHETHYAPLLQMQGAVREIAVEVVAADGSRLPVLVNAVRHVDERGRPRGIRVAVFDASDRRRYEQELLAARRREQQIAQELQRSLLAGELPSPPELEIDVFYRPAVAGLEVGGDWYDAFWIDRQSVALVVGDVVGRGIRAATTMGQLRSAVRALASTGLGPGPLLEALDRYAARHGVGRMTTAVYAELRLDTCTLTYASAGHPPPVLVAADGRPGFLEQARSLPLDVAADGAARPQAAVALEAGARVVLYTDGLIERRDRPLTAGLDALLDALGGPDEPLSSATLARRLEGTDDRDDVCLLSVLVNRVGHR